MLLSTCPLGFSQIPINDVIAGDWFAMYLIGDTVWATGGNNKGQLGQGDLIDISTPAKVKDDAGTGFLTGILQLAAGSEHSMALHQDGTIWAWGNNGMGQLGDNTTTDANLPVQVLDATGTAPLSGVAYIVAHREYSMAVMGDGTVYEWGDGVPLPTSVPFLTDVKKIAVGRGSCESYGAFYPKYTWLVMKNDLTAWSYGCNRWGQVGNGIWGITGCCDPFYEPTPVQVLGEGGVGFLTDVVDVEVGEEFSLAVKLDGSLYAWGLNFGNLIIEAALIEATACGACPNNIEYPLEVPFTPGTMWSNASEVDGGTFSAIVRNTSGEVYVWGRNTAYGTAGVGGINIVYPLQAFVGEGSVKMVDLSENNTSSNLGVVSFDTCKVMSWGARYSGGLGDGSTVSTMPLATNTPVNSIVDCPDCVGSPVADFTYSNSALDYDFTNTSAGATSWIWDFGDGGSSSLENPTYTYAAEGTYTVCLTANNLCGETDLLCVDIQINFGGLFNSTEEQWSMYPNPANDLLNVVLPVASGDVKISVRDVQGRVIQLHTFDALDKIQVSTDGLDEGVYFLTVFSLNGISQGTFAINRN